MSFIADLLQIVLALPQWGIWFVLCCALLIVLIKSAWRYLSQKVQELIVKILEAHTGVQILVEGSKIKGSDPPEYVGFAAIKDTLDKNRTIWENYPSVLFKRCLESSCPHHEKIVEHIKTQDAAMERWHRSAQKALDKFTSDAAIARAETQAYVKGINEDVRLLSEHTLPLIERIVQVMSHHEQSEE